MPPITPEQITIISLMLAIGAAGLKKIWVFGWTYEAKQTEYDSMKTDRDFWRDMALGLLQHNEKAIDVAEKKATGG